MATRTIANGGGNYSSTATWVEGAVPTASDDVVATSSSGQLTVDVTSLCRSVDLTGYTNTVTFTAQLNLGTTTPGPSNVALKLSSGMSTAGSSVISFVSTSSTQQTITCAGQTIACNVTFNGTGSSYQFADSFAINAARTLTHTKGALDSNSQPISVGIWSSSNGNTRSLTLGTSTVTLTGTSAVTIWNLGTATGMTLSAASSTISIAAASSSTRLFAGGGLTYGTLSYTVAGSTGQLTMSDGNTFGTFSFSDTSNARTLKFTSSTTTTVTNWNVNGTSGKLMTISASTSGTAATLSCASGTISSDYLSLKDSTATGGASFYAGTHSTNVSGNTGWTFSGPPTFTQTAIARIAVNKTKTQSAVAYIVPSLYTLTYDCTTQDNTRFVGWNSSVFISGGQLHLNCTSGYPTLTAFGNWDITNNWLEWQVVSYPTGGGTCQSQVTITRDGSNSAQFMINNGNWLSNVETGGSNSGTFGTYDPVNHKYMRMYNSTGTTLLFQGSPDGITWTTLDTRTVTWDMRRVQPSFDCGYYGTETSPPDFVIDNINLGGQGSKTQTAIARIAVNKTKTQSAISRIAVKPTKTQSAISRIAVKPTFTQSAIARIVQLLTKTQSAIARIAVNGTKTQTAVSRVAVKPTFTQSAKASIVITGISTKTQSAIARIAVGLTKTQSAIARVAVGRTKTQPAISRVAVNRTFTQSATARIGAVIHGTFIQTATARVIARATKTQTAKACIQVRCSITQTATARIKLSTPRTFTQRATACISVAVFEPPTVQGNSPLYKDNGNDLVYPVKEEAKQLFKFFKPRAVGQTVIAYNDGTYKVGREFGNDVLTAANVSRVYMGGHKYVVAGAELTALVNAGFTIQTGVTQL